MKRFHSLLLSTLLLFTPALSHAQSPNLLTNPNFEKGTKPWNTPAAHTQFVQGLGRDHSAGLQVDSPEFDYKYHASIQINGLVPGADYEFSTWAKTAPGSPAVKAAVKIEYYNQQGVNVSGKNLEMLLKDTDDWQQISLRLPSKSNTAFARLYLRVFGKGSVIFDDTVFQLAGEPPAITVTAPNPAIIELGKTTPQLFEIRLSKLFTSQTLPRFKATLSQLDEMGNISPASERALEYSVRNLDGHRLSLALEFPPLAAPAYAVLLSYTHEGTEHKIETPVYVYTQVSGRKPQNLTENGTILFQGKPFFPIGIYHPVKMSQRRQPDFQEIQDKALEMVAAQGFNAIQGDSTREIDFFEASLNAAHKHGLAVDVPLYAGMRIAENRESSLDKIRRFGKHPAILNWKIIDEPDMYPKIVHQVPGMYHAIKELDNTIPVELTLNKDHGVPTWKHYSDIVQILRYPVPSRPLTDVSDFTRTAIAQLQPWQNLSFVLQSGWTADMRTQPSPAQARSMVYLALIEGAKGIWWYSLYDPNWDLSKTPLWPHMKQINQETQQLAEPILHGEVVEGITADNKTVLFTARRLNNKIYLLMTNPTDAAANVTFTLPQNVKVTGATWMDGAAFNLNDRNAIEIKLQGIDSRTLVVDAS